ncbi:TPA: hypothetical protein VPC71_000638 [Streptococcus pyogenes]|uniref:Uncharacterized protein n=3 Tax=Streptococcus pyogenes TaxID=1314 RepID=Q9A170_STRP1|nr:hypothetical protein [Streptococcus pyogenes]EPZ41892.1 hypothetical protein HMPREF1228_1413 [Streptococcus pyogenes GA41345]HEP6223537.1 hypothetical protein [Streptococcus pyogenes ABC020014327]HEP6226844.1 hypothetical protein [Streptococcus pyogenes ABC020056369]HEP6228637.1 hypothetical protein [Streptococcus pyogenes ABC020013891]HEP6229952.1 hypothetical protein [Streptococcus pyogenes ABC020041419]HEP6232075.1 hypothetical protein [Streptococcus pyogenes ABC020060258]HEP6238899.1 
MKKTLTLLLALFAIGVTSSVRAEDEQSSTQKPVKFDLDGPQQKIKDYSGNTITLEDLYVGSKVVKIYIPQGWWVYLYRQCDHNSKERGILASPILEKNITKTDPYRQYYTGVPYILNLGEDPLKKGEKLTFSFKGEDGFYVGSYIYRDSDTIKKEKEAEEALQKKEEEKQQKQLEESMLKQIREEDHKPWHQRLSESIQDQWWNFKGLFQ